MLVKKLLFIEESGCAYLLTPLELVLIKNCVLHVVFSFVLFVSAFLHILSGKVRWRLKNSVRISLKMPLDSKRSSLIFEVKTLQLSKPRNID